MGEEVLRLIFVKVILILTKSNEFHLLPNCKQSFNPLSSTTVSILDCDSSDLRSTRNWRTIYPSVAKLAARKWLKITRLVLDVWVRVPPLGPRLMALCRNWQPRLTQNQLHENAYGFESHQCHQSKSPRSCLWCKSIDFSWNWDMVKKLSYLGNHFCSNTWKL